MLENVKLNLGQLVESDGYFWPIRELSIAVDAFHAISSALELGLFQCLQKPKNPQELARILNLHPGMTEKLCQALTSLGYLTKVEDCYILSEVARTFLIDTSPYYQGNLIRLLKRTQETRWRNLSKALKEGPIEVQAHQDVFDVNFSLAMAEGAVCGSLQKTIRVLRDLPQFQRAKRCLDLGGCHGLYALAFTMINPELSVVIFDLPNVINAVTTKVISGSERIAALAGDFNRDELGDGYDFIFASDVLYMPEAALKALLLKIKNSLNDGGLLISKHYHIDNLKEDSAAVLFDLMFAVTGGGNRIYSTSKFSHFLESCGFSVMRVEDIGNHVSRSKIVIAEKV